MLTSINTVSIRKILYVTFDNLHFYAISYKNLFHQSDDSYIRTKYIFLIYLQYTNVYQNQLERCYANIFI